jgi:LysR family cyn operon transcriptional activator
MRSVHEMELRHLRAFVAIVDAGGVGRAIGRLHLSQPALSRQIRALESALSVRLFDRVGRRVRLTSEGEDLLRQSRRLLAEVDSLEERARALQGGRAGILRVGGTPQLMEGLLADFLPQYGQRYPGVEIHLIEDGGASLHGRLEHGDVHLGLMLAGDARFEERVLFPIYFLAVAASLPGRATHGGLEFRELADARVLILRPGFGAREWFDAACRIAQVRPRVLLESAAPHTMVALARAGYGIALVPSAVRFDRRGVRTRPLLLDGTPIGGGVSVAWDPRRFLPPYARAFADEVQAFSRRGWPGRDVIRRRPRLPPPRSPGAPGPAARG